MWNNQVNIIVDPMFPLSVCWCNQGPKSPKGLRTQGGNYHQTLRSSLLLENCAMLSFLTLFISSFQSLCRGTLFWDLVHVGDFIDTLATRRGWTCWLLAIPELVLWCPRKRIYWGEVATQVLRSFAVNLELFEAWKKVRKQKILSYLSHRKQDYHFHKADGEYEYEWIDVKRFPF